MIIVYRRSGTRFDAGVQYGKKSGRPQIFRVHCAHSYWAYREVCEAIFGEEGTRIAERVLDDFAAEYGKKMADTLAGYARTNFNIAD